MVQIWSLRIFGYYRNDTPDQFENETEVDDDNSM